MLTRSLSLLPLVLTIIASPISATESPNLVLIFIDDMGYGDIGPYGSDLNRTPNLDRMAAEGMMLTSFYAAPVCSASRAQLMTGCYAPRVSVPGVFFPAGPKGLNPEEITVADYLHELGYATTCVGKWHLGDQPPFLPTNNGFDHYFGIPYSNDMQRNTLEDGRRVTPLLRDDKVAELLEDEGQRRVTREYTEEAVKFIEDNVDKPFFLYLPHTAMHIPLFPHPDFVGKSRNGTYGDWVEEVDWSVGQVLDTLRQHKLEKNTLVLFTSDNGPWASKGKDGGVSGPLRGSKGCTLEGGVREPTIAWWPGRIESGSSCDAIAGTTDVLPTFVALAGGKLRDDVKIDGCDVSKVLMGESTESPHEAWYYYQGTNLQAVRSGPWKLAIKPQSLGMGIKERPEDLKASGVRLYNLDDEIGEITNVAETHPDVVARLQKLADDMIADIGSGKPGPGVRPAGSVENPVTLYPTQPRKSTRKPSGKPIEWRKVKQGDAYSSGSAPAIAGRPFSIRCSIEADKPAGVIIAHGGSAVGYALYAKDGEIVFAVRHSSSQIQRVSIPVGPEKIIAIQAGLNAKGVINLSLNGGKAVTTKSPGLLKSHPQEDFCVGHDNRNPLDDQASETPFSGKISDVIVTFE
jgi:arylsulfatase A